MIMIKHHINLHILKFYLPGSEDKADQASEASLDGANQWNLNLNEGDKELLISHLRLVHIAFGKIKHLSLNGALLLNGAAATERSVKVICS